MRLITVQSVLYTNNVKEVLRVSEGKVFESFYTSSDLYK